MKDEKYARGGKTTLRGASPNICPLRARLVDELLGLRQPEPKVTKVTAVITRVNGLNYASGRSIYKNYSERAS